MWHAPLLLYVAALVAASHTAAGAGQSSEPQPQPQPQSSSASVEGEAWSYERVRLGASMFWWLYRSSAASAPLVIWLQGGPGASATGFGNFNEIGALDADMKPRANTWLKHANLLFIDNPVGSGFSYVDDDKYLAVDNQQISLDLLAVLKSFLQKQEEFVHTPLWIFSESYGGKMATGFGNAILDAIAAGEMPCNFKGVALGDSWISPIDSIWSWSRLLRSTSLVDQEQEKKLEEMYQLCLDAVNRSSYAEATLIWSNIENSIETFTDNVDFYNILKHDPSETSSNGVSQHLRRRQPSSLSELMNGPIRKKLGIIPDTVIWGSQSSKVFAALSADFMTPVVSGVDRLLSHGVQVHVYSGQLDLIVATLGTERWMERLKWPYLKNFFLSPKVAFATTQTQTACFRKTFNNLSFYTIMNAGHMVPRDMPLSSVLLLQMITNGATSEMEEQNRQHHPELAIA